MNRRPRILFLCTGNSARSQMAEGWARYLFGERAEIYSAGTTPRGLHPLAVEVMKEKNIDISQQRSKSLAEVPNAVDYVITLCAEADVACPTLAGQHARLQWHLPDPAKATGSIEERLRVFRTVRDELEIRLRNFCYNLSGGKFSSAN